MYLYEADAERMRRAIRFGCKVHAQDSWGDFPYATHLALVAVEARNIEEENPALEAAAWLHDVVEDHPEYTEELKDEFPELFEIVSIVSRVDGETYDDFITRILETYNLTAIELKLADMRVNLSNGPRESLRKRYEKNIGRLEHAVMNMTQDW